MTVPTSPASDAGTTLALPPDAAAYAVAVRSALADLPAAEREEVCEDLDAHLADVSAELGPAAPEGALVERLGPPDAYAVELRAAAGYPSPVVGVPGTPTLGERFGAVPGRVRQDGAALVRWIESLPGGAGTVHLLRELRPAWWVLRAWVAVAALGLAFAGGRDGFPIPGFGGGGQLIGLLLLLAAVALSVLLGRRAPSSSGLRALSVVGNVLAVLLLLPVLGSRDGVVSVDGGYAQVGPVVEGPLMHEDGTPITNVYPFDADGRPLSGVFLFDQDGRRIDNLADPDCWVQAPRDTSGGLPLERLAADPRTYACVATGERAPDFSVVLPRSRAGATAPDPSTPDPSTPDPSNPTPSPATPTPGPS